MKKISSFLVFALLILSSYGQTQVTSASINLRETPNGQVVSVIPNGTSVELTGDCDQGWCPTEYNGQAGYVSKAYLKDAQGQSIQVNSNQPQSPVHYYTNSDGKSIQAPTNTIQHQPGQAQNAQTARILLVLIEEGPVRTKEE